MVDRDQAWSTLLETVRCAQTVITQWTGQRLVNQAQSAEWISELQRQHEAWCLDRDAHKSPPTPQGYLPPQPNETQGIRGYRAGLFVLHFIDDMKSRRRVSLSQFHSLRADASERLQAVARTLQREGVTISDLSSQVKPSQVTADSSIRTVVDQLNQSRGSGQPQPAEVPDASTFPSPQTVEPVRPATPRRKKPGIAPCGESNFAFGNSWASNSLRPPRLCVKESLNLAQKSVVTFHENSIR